MRRVLFFLSIFALALFVFDIGNGSSAVDTTSSDSVMIIGDSPGGGTALATSPMGYITAINDASAEYVISETGTDPGGALTWSRYVYNESIPAGATETYATANMFARDPRRDLHMHARAIGEYPIQTFRC